jgi:hypothetical protein
MYCSTTAVKFQRDFWKNRCVKHRPRLWAQINNNLNRTEWIQTVDFKSCAFRTCKTDQTDRIHPHVVWNSITSIFWSRMSNDHNREKEQHLFATKTLEVLVRLSWTKSTEFRSADATGRKPGGKDRLTKWKALCLWLSACKIIRLAPGSEARSGILTGNWRHEKTP